MKKKLLVGLMTFLVVGSLMTGAFAAGGHEIHPGLDSVDPIFLSM